MLLRSLFCSRRSRLRSRARSIHLDLDHLEGRLAPATFAATRVGSTLVITQTSPLDPKWDNLKISDNPGDGTVILGSDHFVGPIPMFEIFGRFETGGSANLAVRLVSNDLQPVSYHLGSSRTGSASLNMSNTFARILNLAFNGEIKGNLNVLGGNGALTAQENGNGLRVARNATFRGGSENDWLILGGANTTIGGTLTTIGFDAVGTNPGDKVGAVVFKNPGGTYVSGLTLDGTTLTRGLTYIGGNKSDTVVLGGQPTKIGGDVRINFGKQADAQASRFRLYPGCEISGRVIVTGGEMGSETFEVDGIVKGNLAFNLGGGANHVAMTGSFLGSFIQYVGGTGIDDINYSPQAGSTISRFAARLGEGADKVKLTSLSGERPSAVIDFGAGTDTFEGTVNYSCTFLNLP